LTERELQISAEGLKKLEAELEHLKTVRRAEVAERIKTAREFGDISENSEYEDAKNEQGLIEARIQSLESMLRNARVVDEATLDPHVVHIGSHVTVQEEGEDAPEEFVIVSVAEADPVKNRISVDSPVGKALLGAHADDWVDVTAPVGRIRMKVLAIQ
jgi:transcription elongation factor GreA